MGAAKQAQARFVVFLLLEMESHGSCGHGSLHTSVPTPPSDSPLHRSGSSGSCASEAHAANREGEEALAGASVGLLAVTEKHKSMSRADWKAHPIIRTDFAGQKYGF